MPPFVDTYGKPAPLCTEIEKELMEGVGGREKGMGGEEGEEIEIWM